jgi:hypothetical protein
VPEPPPMPEVLRQWLAKFILGESILLQSFSPSSFSCLPRLLHPHLPGQCHCFLAPRHECLIISSRRPAKPGASLIRLKALFSRPQSGQASTDPLSFSWIIPCEPADPSIADERASVEDWVMAGDDKASQRHAVADQAAGAVEALPPKPMLPPKPRLPAKRSLSCFTTNIDWLQHAMQQS